MSNTPKTDAACGWPWGHHGRIESNDLLINVDGPFVHAAVARELERENAALRRDVYQCPPTSENDYEGFKWRDACEELERENAELRKKFMFAESEIILLREDREELRELTARMAKEMRETDHEFCSLVDYDNLQNKI